MQEPLKIEQLPEMSTALIAAMDADKLAVLQQEVEEHCRKAKEIKECLDEAIAKRYSDRAALFRHQNNKPTGIIRFHDGNFVIVADQPKKPEWDQSQLASIAEQLRSIGEEPADYIDTSYKVSESRFEAWPTTVRQLFTPARTLKVGRATFKLEPLKNRGGA